MLTVPDFVLKCLKKKINNNNKLGYNFLKIKSLKKKKKKKLKKKLNHSAPAKDYGLFLPGDESAGLWLEAARPLSHYTLKESDQLEYRRKMRQLRVRMLDDAVKTLMVDDSLPVSQLMINICTKIGNFYILNV